MTNKTKQKNGNDIDKGIFSITLLKMLGSGGRGGLVVLIKGW